MDKALKYAVMLCLTNARDTMAEHWNSGEGHTFVEIAHGTIEIAIECARDACGMELEYDAVEAKLTEVLGWPR